MKPRPATRLPRRRALSHIQLAQFRDVQRLSYGVAPGASQLSGAGIYLDATGEPKSGTTWLGRIVPQIALELCGSQNNKW